MTCSECKKNGKEATDHSAKNSIKCPYNKGKHVATRSNVKISDRINVNSTSIIEKKKEFVKLNLKILELILKDPSLLKEDDIIIKKKLQSQGNSDSQGTGNQITSQESSFAKVLEINGFTFIPKSKKNDHINHIQKNNIIDGFYYIYQVNGTQASIDFATILIIDKLIIEQFNFDLKHTTSNIFYLNDGWFHKDIIYIVSWIKKLKKEKENMIFIGLGQDIPTKEENDEMKILLNFKKEKNSSNKKVGSLYTYIRFANRFSCERFNIDYTNDKFKKVKDFINK